MFRYIMAFAATALLASQVQAATISGPTTVQAGQTYTYTYVPDEPTEILEGYEFFVFRLRVTGPNGTSGFDFSGSDHTTVPSYQFNWIFDTTGSAILSAISYLETYKNADLIQGEFGPEVIKPEGWESRSAFSERVALQISVVPIGGTLPLLVSALGLMGWAARRRAQKAALPA